MQLYYFFMLSGLCLGLPDSVQASSFKIKGHKFVPYTQARLSKSQKQVITETKQWVKKHSLRHGDSDPVKLKWVTGYVLNILWRESNFRNVVNHNDRSYDGSRQTVSGYAQFRDDSYQELLRSYEKGYPQTFPKNLKAQCSSAWKTGENALRCQVEVLTYAVRRFIDGSPRHLRRWGTASKAWVDTQNQFPEALPVGRSLASN